MRRMDEYISRAEHEEFAHRMEDAHRRQDKRLELLEGSVEQIGAIARSVDKLAQSVQQMCKEQERQGKRLEALEGQDGQKWRQVVSYVTTAVIGILLGFLATQLGLK